MMIMIIIITIMIIIIIIIIITIVEVIVHVVMMMMMMIMMRRIMMMIMIIIIMVIIITIIIALRGAIRYFFTISSLRRELSPTHTLKRPGSNRVQITYNTSIAYHVQHAAFHVVRRDSSAVLSCQSLNRT